MTIGYTTPAKLSFEVIAPISNPESVTHTTPLPVTIRPAYPTDARALSRLAGLDSSVVPAEPLLVAEVDGELRVAVSMSDGAVIADPFAPTSHIVQMVQDHIARTSAPPARPRFGFRPALAAVLRTS
jgi:hypothetical protein